MDHLFCVNGNGYYWVDGELVERQNKVVSLQDAIEKSIEFHSCDSPGIDLKIFFLEKDNKLNKEGIKNFAEEIGDKIKKDVRMCFRLDERYNDKEIPTPEKYPDHFVDGEDWTFYPLNEYSRLCCLPDDVKDDWLDAATWMLGFIKNHREYMDPKRDYDSWLKKVETRINDINNKRKNYGAKNSKN